MAKELPNIIVNVDTFQSWITKTNNVIDAINNEVLTANSTAGITGTTLAPKNARLVGTFTANSIVSLNTFAIGGVSANGTHLTIASRLVANNTAGVAGQILTSNGTGVYWSAAPSALGTVTSVSGANGIAGSVTSSGTLSIDAKTGLVANTTGLYVNTAFIESLISTTPPVISGDLNMGGNDIVNVGEITTTNYNAFGFTRSGAFLIGQSFGHTILSLDSDSIGIRINDASTGPTLDIGTFSVNSFRFASPAGFAFSTAGTDRLVIESSGRTTVGGIEVGFKIIPQESLAGATTLNTTLLSGRHLYKNNTSSIIVAVPVESSPIGTTITIVNDGSSGNITLSPAATIQLQLGGTFNVSSRTIAPGGFATMLKVTATKWIVSGPGVS